MDNLVVIEDCLETAETAINGEFKPLLLMVPLRLGITEINPIYFEGLKGLFEIPGCVGMIGGRPNQALFFFGYVEDEALFLDPHTTQNAGTVGSKLADDELQMDETYHQRFAMRINFRQIDPSLAIGFLCKTRAEFDGLCDRLTTNFKTPGRQALFEISRERLTPWELGAGSTTTRSRGGMQAGDANGFDMDDVLANDAEEDSDEEFEIIA